jgi:hypothetical protein
VQEVPLPGRQNLSKGEILPHEFKLLADGIPSSYTLTTSYAQVTGSELIIYDPGWWMVTAFVPFIGSGAGDAGADGQVLLYKDGAQHSSRRVSFYNLVEATGGQQHGGSVSMGWRLEKTNRGPTVLQLWARKTSGTGGSYIHGGQTSLIAFTLPRV